MLSSRLRSVCRSRLQLSFVGLKFAELLVKMILLFGTSCLKLSSLPRLRLRAYRLATFYASPLFFPPLLASSMLVNFDLSHQSLSCCFVVRGSSRHGRSSSWIVKNPLLFAPCRAHSNSACLEVRKSVSRSRATDFDCDSTLLQHSPFLLWPPFAIPHWKKAC